MKAAEWMDVKYSTVRAGLKRGNGIYIVGGWKVIVVKA